MPDKVRDTSGAPSCAPPAESLESARALPRTSSDLREPPAPTLTTTCLINHHNYGRYVEEAVASVRAQSVPFDEIILVDDGSTDGSLERIRPLEADGDDLRIVAKENGGQLSCFNRGVAEARGDLVFFLDADDLYEPEYLETVLELYRRFPRCDFSISAYRKFGREDVCVQRFAEDTELGFSAVLALLRDLERLYVSPTSTLSIRRRVLERFLPVPLTDDWRTRADDCLFFGASLAGACKAYSARPLVKYRVHERNHWHGKRYTRAYEYRRHLAVTRLLRCVLDRLSYGDDLVELAPREFKTIRRPRFEQFKTYLRIVAQSRLGTYRKLQLSRAVFKYYRRALRDRLLGRKPRPRPEARDH